jgi:hypothetical protein
VSESNNINTQLNKGAADTRANDEFTRSLVTQLDSALEGVTVDTQRQLRMARAAACEKAAVNRGVYARWLMSAGSLAAMAAVAVVSASLWLLPSDVSQQTQLAALEDLALLSDAEGLEFYQQLDFYLWLDDENAG